MELPSEITIAEQLLSDSIVKDFDDVHWLVQYLDLDEAFAPWHPLYSRIKGSYLYKNKNLDLAISRYLSMYHELTTKPEVKIVENNLTSIIVKYKDDNLTRVGQIEIYPTL